jgi:hypothetical protein
VGVVGIAVRRPGETRRDVCSTKDACWRWTYICLSSKICIAESVIFWDARLQRGENGWCGEVLSRDVSGLPFSAREWLSKDLRPQFTDRAFCWAPESGWLKS